MSKICPECPDSIVNPGTNTSVYDADALRLEMVTTCVGFDDILDVTLAKNHPHFDTVIVVTTHADKATQKVCRKHSVICVQTDLFFKNGRKFNKGAAINSGFDYFQWYGIRMHLDADIILPDNFRRILFNHSYLERDCIYGADRVNVVGIDKVKKLVYSLDNQQKYRLILGPIEEANTQPKLGHRLVCSLRGYLPLGFFQLWHASCQKPYPYSLGTAAHDDMMFSALWPESKRRLLPGAICYQVLGKNPKIGENWEGRRKQPRIDEVTKK